MIMDYMNTQPMFTNKVIVFGTNDLAELTHWYLTNDSDYEIVAFTVNREHLKDESLLRAKMAVMVYKTRLEN